jgi:hypothetical protein
MRRWGGIRHIHTYSLHSFTHIHTVINEATWDTFILPGFLPLVAHSHSVFATFCEFNSPASLRPPLQQPHGTRSPNFLPTVAYAYTVCNMYNVRIQILYRMEQSKIMQRKFKSWIPKSRALELRVPYLMHIMILCVIFYILFLFI